MTTLLFLALILTFEMLPVSPTTTSPTTTGEISIIEEGSLEAGSALILSCTIPDFTGSAQWGRDNNIYTTCLYAGFCSVVHTENYTFGSNASGIFVTINPLSMVDNGSIWMCSNQVYTTSYTVIVQTTIAPTTGKISINGIGSLEVDSVLTLSCIIPAFTGGATWRRGNINLVTCAFNSFCTIESTERYTFAGNNSGIFVTIYTLSMSDNGTKWICYDGDDSTSYTVFVHSSFIPPPGEFSIVVKGSFEAGSALLLSCIIPTFTGHASLSRENVVYTICTPDACDTNPMVNYTFASNTSGIFVTIDPLTMTENGTKWHCNHNFDNTFYTVFVQSSTTTSTIATESTIAPTTGMLSLVVQGSSEVDSTLILSCIIPTFTGSATWSRENIIKSTCFHDLCFPYMQQHYTFSSNNSDIFVAIYPLSMTENGTTWTCYHGDDSASYTVLVQSSITTNQPPTESTIAQPPGEFSIVGKGSFEAGSALLLSCIIPRFTESASWYRDNVLYAMCTSDTCSAYPLVNYAFSSNTSGIFVTIYPLAVTDNGTEWNCNHIFDHSVYTVFVQPSITTNQPPTESTFVPLPGEYSIFGKGSFEAGSALLLSCIIPTFTGHALWYRDNVLYAYCTPDTCDTYSTMVNYTFASNTSGIFATIDPLSMTENGTEWNCNHNVFNTVYTVFLQSTIAPTTESSITNNQPPTGKISINGIGSLEVDSVLILACVIPTFTRAAEWIRGNMSLAVCSFDSACIIKSMNRYTFAGNNSGIFVTIYSLSDNENGTTWICNDGDDSTSYTVFVQPSIPTNQPPTVSCEEPYQKIGNGCYSIHDNTISGDEAFASCTDPGAYLANFETVEEAMFMKVFLQRNKTGISYFVGGRNVNRYISSGDWRWIKHGNATKMTYFAFAPGQPSWSAEKGEDCMFFYANDRYNFYNVMCDNGHFLGGFICEI